MKTFPAIIIAALIISGCAQKEKKSTADKSKVTLGIIDSLESKILKEQRKIWVYTPPDTTRKYPLVVLLDGDGHYSSVVGMIQQLSTVNGNTILPEMVIVAIPNTDRTRDLTPTHVAVAFGDSTFVKTSGGADNFAMFMRDELFPYVEKKYPVTSYRTLIGHSFGGLFAINTIVHHPDMFSNYLAIDPSMWWDERKLTTQALEAFSKNDYTNKNLFVAVANTMNEGQTLESVKNDTAEATAHIRSIMHFNEQVQKLKNGLGFSSKYYGDDDHSSVPLIATYDGLRGFFHWYNMKAFNKYFDKASTATPQEMISHIKQHYENISKHYGYTQLPAEGSVNSMGYGFMFNKMPEKAFACFELNIQNYPKSANAHDSMGDYYLSVKDTVHAKEYFNKALAIQPLDYTKDKLSKLK